MTMSENEICKSYTEALDKRKQRVVLADLNVCSKREIDQILQKSGLLEPAKKRKIGNKKIDDERAMKLHQEGKTDKEIAADFGACEAAVASWRNRNGLSKNPVPQKEKKPLSPDKNAQKKPEVQVMQHSAESQMSEARKEGMGITVEIYFPDGVVPCQIRILGGNDGDL